MKQQHREFATCPHCQKTDSVIRYGFSSAQTPRAKCKACNKTFSITLQPMIGDEKRTFDLIRKHNYQLKRIRENWCRRPRHKRPIPDRTNITVVLDGSRIVDIPTFYIVLGEAINGPGGYYGAGLDALDDCLGGYLDPLTGCFHSNFGLFPPFVLEVIGLEHVRTAVDSSKCATRLERLQWQRNDPEGFAEQEADNESFWAEVMNGEIEGITEEELQEILNPRPYFDIVLEILTGNGVTVREHGQVH
jgi:Barstar (barnase inhibitor)